jgi:Fe-S-cluster-containing hydrogenase component 2
MFNPRSARIRVQKYNELGIDEPTLCHQCIQCPPEDACPTRAFQREEDGTVKIDESACNACYICVDTCPHGAVFRPAGKGPPLVCDLCDGEPLCVRKCPTHALTISAENSQLSNVEKR